MSTALGGGGSLPIGNTSPIEIPTDSAPQNQLRTDEKIPLPSSGTVEGSQSYKVLSRTLDQIPGYLDAKISDQFTISNNKIELINFNGLDSDSLTEGSINLYYTTARFNTDFSTKDSDDVTEGSVNKYFTSVGFDTYFGLKDTDDLNEGSVNKYYASSLFDIDFSAKSTSDLIEGTNLYYTETRFNSSLSSKTTSDIAEGSNLYYTDARFDSKFNTKTTDDLTEGNSNFYLTETGFDTILALKSTSDLVEGTNLYYTDTRFDARLSSKTTDDITEGSLNKYISTQQASDITSNTSTRHTHANKSLLDSYDQSNSGITSAVADSHTHTNKAILDGTEESFTTALKTLYDSYGSGQISSVNSPLDLSVGVLSHLNSDGNKHVPSNSGVNQYWVLASGTSAGIYTWTNVDDIIANSTVLEATPSTSIIKGVQSAYINTHVTNSTTDIKHVTDANLTYINTTIPTHIGDSLIHLPSITPTTDQGKFLWVDTNDEPVWTTSATNIVITGESYISAIGDTITAAKIDLNQTNIAEGANITFSGNQIISEQRAISSSSSSGDLSTSISSGWAYDHENNLGNNGHVPASSSSGYFLAWDGSFKDISQYAGNIDALEYVLKIQEDNTLDPGLIPTLGDRYIILAANDLNSNFGTIVGLGDNDVVEFNGSVFEVTFDASNTLVSVDITVEQDPNGNMDRQWFYSYIGVEWRDRGISNTAFAFTDSLINTDGSVNLDGDNATPGNTRYYGTNGSGTKGFYELPAGVLNNKVSISSLDTTPGFLFDKITSLDGSILFTKTDPEGNESLDLSIATIAHSSLNEIGSNTHDQIDSHISNTSNPHQFPLAAQGVANGGVSNLAQTFDGEKDFSSNLKVSFSTVTAHRLIFGDFNDINTRSNYWYDSGSASVRNDVASSSQKLVFGTYDGTIKVNLFEVKGNGGIVINTTPTTDTSNSPMIVRDVLTGELKTVTNNVAVWETALHSNRTALDLVSGTNTGDQDLSGYQPLASVLTNTTASFTTTLASNISTNNSKISYTDSAAVALNTAKISFDNASSTRLANTSGTNTGDEVETPVQVKTASFTAVGGVPYRVEGSTALTASTPASSGDRVSIVNASTAITTVGSLGDLAAGDSCVLYYDTTWKEYTNRLT